MAVIAFASVAGAPGVTTTATAATLTWPEQALLLEVDTSKTTDVLVGYFRGAYEHTRGLTGVMQQHGRERITANTLLDQALRLTEANWPAVVPGFNSLAAGAAAQRFWNELPTAFYELRQAGTHVLLDLGRLRIEDPRFPLVAAADLTILLLEPRLPNVLATLMHAGALREQLEAAGRPNTLRLLTVDRGRETYSDRAIAKQVGIPVIARLPRDPGGAGNYSLGAPSRSKSLTRAVTALDSAILDIIRERDAQLAVATQTQEQP